MCRSDKERTELPRTALAGILLLLASFGLGIEAGPAGAPPDGLIDDAEIAEATFVDLDFERFPELPLYVVPSSNVVFVATDGNDTGKGTLDSPFRTIAHAVRRAAADANIVVRSGDYLEAFEADDYRAVVLDKDGLVLMAYPGETVTLRPAPGVTQGIVVNAERLVIRGIDLEGFSTVGILFDAGRVRNRHIVIADLEIAGSEEAIAMWEPSGSVDELLLANVETDAIIHCGSGPCNNWRLENVTIDASGKGWGADAFAIESGDNILVVNTTVLSAGSDGIDTKATRVVVLNCWVEGVQNNAVKLWHGGDVINTVISRGRQNPVVVEEGHFRLLNSTIGFTPQYHGHRDYSMICGYDERKPMQVEIINSVIANPSGAAWINPESTAVSIRNSLFYTADGSEILIHGNFQKTYGAGADAINQKYGSGNLVADPELEDDLRPGATSPAINAGIVLSTDYPRHDREGHERAQGGAPDIGAYERPAAEPTARPEVSEQPVALIPRTLTEDFESEDLDASWKFKGPGVRVAQAGKILSCSDRSYATRLEPQLQDFTLDFRYRHGTGAGDVIVRASGEPPQNRQYHVRFLEQAVQLLRRDRDQEQELATASHVLSRGRWYRVTIESAGGELEVSVGGVPMIRVRDGRPLPAGHMAFGCLTGSGFAYDDIEVSR